jgi:hypothetical protein
MTQIRVYTAPEMDALLTSWTSHPDRVPASPNAADDEYAEAALDTTGTRTTGATAWSWYRQGTSTATISGLPGRRFLTLAPQIDGTVRGVLQSAPSGTWRFRTYISKLTSASGYAGMFVYDSASNTGIQWALASSNSVTGYYVWKVNTAGAWQSGADIVTSNVGQLGRHSGYLETEYDGTNLIFRFSNEGDDGTFEQVTSQVATSVITHAPTHVGLASGSATFISRWWRRMA